MLLWKQGEHAGAFYNFRSPPNVWRQHETFLMLCGDLHVGKWPFAWLLWASPAAVACWVSLRKQFKMLKERIWPNMKWEVTEFGKWNHLKLGYLSRQGVPVPESQGGFANVGPGGTVAVTSQTTASNQVGGRLREAWTSALTPTHCQSWAGLLKPLCHLKKMILFPYPKSVVLGYKNA